MKTHDWPAHWMPVSEWLEALGEGGKTRQVLARAIVIAKRLNIDMNFGFANNALKRLVKIGLAEIDEETGIYTPAGETYTIRQIRDACDAAGANTGRVIGFLRGETDAPPIKAGDERERIERERIERALAADPTAEEPTPDDDLPID